jgi:magnesium chelatase family protein
MDICVEALPVEYQELEEHKVSESSKDIRIRVMEARNIQLKRYQNEPIYFNSQLTPKAISQYCKLGKDEKELIKNAFAKMNLSARAYHRILKVARTIADLDHSELIKVKHLSEAICYRNLDKKYMVKE